MKRPLLFIPRLPNIGRFLYHQLEVWWEGELARWDFDCRWDYYNGWMWRLQIGPININAIPDCEGRWWEEA